VLEQIEQHLTLDAVALSRVDVTAHVRGHAPAVVPIVALFPPAIEDAEVDHAIQAGLLTRRAARLLRAAAPY
jgi:hypothetical protein